MLVLAIESSTKLGSVALFNKSILLASRKTLLQRSHSEFLNVAIQEILVETKRDLRNIELFATTLGPGSFTGLRVSGNITKTLSYVFKKKMWVVDSLSVLKYQSKRSENILACINAFKNMVYVSTWSKVGGRSPPAAVNINEINAYLTQFFAKEPFHIIGDGFLLIESQLKKSELQYSYDPIACNEPTAESLGEMAVQANPEGRSLDWNLYSPLYIRSSEAEENLRLTASEKL